MPEQQNIPWSLPETCATRDGIVAGGSRAAPTANIQLAETAAVAPKNASYHRVREGAHIKCGYRDPIISISGMDSKKRMETAHARLPACMSACFPPHARPRFFLLDRSISMRCHRTSRKKAHSLTHSFSLILQLSYDAQCKSSSIHMHIGHIQRGEALT